MKTRILALLALVPGLIVLNSCSQKQAEAGDDRPNVLFIAIDDLNDWLGCMGHPDALTPNIDRLAGQGVLFTSAQCQAPLCGPSRASLMTGLRPSTTGIYGMIDDNMIRADNEVTRDIRFLPEYFRDQGYHTMGIGKLFHQHAPDRVFDESGGREPGFGPVPPERIAWDGYGTADRDRYGRTSTDWGAFPEADSLMPDHRSADWAIRRLKGDYHSPFFLAVGFLRPHVPWYVPQHWFDLHPVDSISLPPYRADDLDDVPEVALKINDLPMMPSTEWAIGSGQWPSIVQAYLACVSFVDHEVGRVLDALSQSEYRDNTVIVLWSDHGYRLGEKGTFAKHALWETATNAPLIFAGPGIPAGRKENAPVEMLSIYPTLLELCHLPAYPGNEGISLVPLMCGSGDNVPETRALTTYGWNNHALRTREFRYIRYEDGSEEIYDRAVDPNEWTNLADDPAYAPVKRDLEQFFPTENPAWAEHSSYDFQPYFVEQKERQQAR